MIKTDKMSISIHRLYGLWVMLLVSLVASAQRFVNVALEGGQTICSITQDEQGLMWIGTDNGLFSYDGYHGYRHYVDHAFSNTRVNALAVEKNILYMATANGVLQFDMHADIYVKNTVVECYQDETKRKTIKELR
ncbi:MAG: two-component regulator propeller domain-containing protein, partial [bacterium]|nr:two-component regulator propeller domain-containing protein [bacterium]